MVWYGMSVTPMETIKTKLIQTNQPLVAGVSSILRESGFRGLYQVRSHGNSTLI